MHIAGAALMIDTCAVFFGLLRISGWFHAPGETLAEVTLVGEKSRAGEVCLCGEPHEGVAAALGEGKGFVVNALFDAPPDPRTLGVRFRTDQGRTIDASVSDLVQERLATDAPQALFGNFYSMLEQLPHGRILDVGGRARSGRDRSGEVPGQKAVVLDILPGPNVDVVGDAHCLSQLFPAQYFGGFMSIAVFEHLAMPWKVAVEINRVLKTGGIGFVLSHQALGMHDAPWDFWRFSDQAWRSLFNKFTGFEILGTALGGESFLIPFFWRANKIGAERAVGYEMSAVLVRKTAECSLDWNIRTADFLDTTYPLAHSSVDLSLSDISDPQQGTTVPPLY